MLQVLFHDAAICKLTSRKSVPALYGTQKQFLPVDVYEGVGDISTPDNSTPGIT